MSRRRFVSLLMVALLATAIPGQPAGAQTSTQTKAPNLPTVFVLATGGTIAGAATTNVQAGYTSGQVGVEQLIAAVPEAKKLANLRGEQISNIGSQDMNDEVWLKLANRVNALVAMPDVAGVVITHGTDTIEETAYFLNLVIKSQKPVVLTAAMRPATALSADGPLNFFNAVAVAANKDATGRGVLVVVNDWIHGAASLTKTSTTAVQTFLSPQSGLIGTVAYGNIEFYRGPIGKHTAGSEFSLAGVTALPRVDIIMAHENMDGALIDAAAAAGAKGIVIAGVGNGNLTQPAVSALAAQVKKGIVCVRASRVVTGVVGRNVELEDDKLGFVASLDKNPQKARVLLRLALLTQRSAADVQRIFDEVLTPAPMQQLAAFLHEFPGLCLFLSIVLGHIIGRFHFKGVGFGAVVGTLLAGIAVGILAKPELPDLLRWVFFYLFLFSIGYSVGPQFFGSLKKEAVPQIVLSLVVAVSGLATVIAVAMVFDFNEGIAVGLLSGGMTQSAALGTGLSAIAELPIPEELKTKLIADAPLADAITYGFGDLGLILFLTSLGPKIMRADLKSEAKALEKTLSGGKEGQLFAAALYGMRGYLVENEQVAGSSVEALEHRFSGGRLSVQRVQRGDEMLKLNPALRLERGDRIVVSAGRAAFVDAERSIGPEIVDLELLSVPLATVAAVVTSREVNGKTLSELGQDPSARGVYLESIHRSTEPLPREPGTMLERGDILRIVGAPDDVARAAKRIGFVERDLAATDLTFLAGGVCLGMMLGLLKMNAAGIVLGLGTAGSILVVGLVAGWARSRYPVFGSIPEPAQRLLMDIGLIVFIAIVGMHAGPHAVEAYHTSGGAYFASIFVAGMLVTIVPLAAGTIAARYVLKMSPLMTLGGLAGAQTCTPGLNALREASDSNVGSLAYTVPYAIGNILLTVWGPVVVAIVHAMRTP